MKLLSKYSLYYLVLIGGIFIFSAAVFYLLIPRILNTEMDGELIGIEAQIKDYVESNHALPDPGSNLGEETIEFASTGNQRIDAASVSAMLYSRREKKMHNTRIRIFPLRFNNNWYSVHITKPVGGIHHLSRALITVTVITIAFMLLLFLVLNSFVLRHLWHPFYDSMRIMRNFKLGNTASLSFPKTSTEEFQFMNESLLMAAEKAAQDYLLLKEFTENASHEIQTPLAIIRSKLDMLIQEELTEKQIALTNGAYAAIKRLAGLNQSLLLLTKIENKQFSNSEYIDLDNKVTEKLTQFKELWQSREIVVEQQIQKSIINMHPFLLDILLNNLFSNASNHNKPGGVIGIQLTGKQLIISNTALAGPLDETRVFTRFYKKSADHTHNGLGLSITQQIAKNSALNISYHFAAGRHVFTVTWH